MKRKISIIVIFLCIIVVIYPFVGNSFFKYQQNISIEKFRNEIANKDNEENIDKHLYDIGKMIGYIRILKLDLNLPIYKGTEEKILQNGIGYMTETTLPNTKERYHTILLGHTGILGKKLFDDLPNLNIDDIFEITILDQTFYYKVYDKKIITKDYLEKNEFNSDGQFVTLITCIPKFVNTHRLLITGKMLENQG